MVSERIKSFRKLMKRMGIDAYMIPSADFHSSEYVGEYFKCREHLSGFTGSAGTLVITASEAGLWVDGRYFVQAETQLAGTGIDLYRSGEAGVPDITAFLNSRLPQNGVLGFDGRVIPASQALALQQALKEKWIRLETAHDLPGIIWENRPALSREPIRVLEERYAGRSAAEKLEAVRSAMGKQGADFHILTTLDDIAWVLNIRGSDVRCTPVSLAYLVLSKSECFLFTEVDPEGGGSGQIIPPETAAHLKSLSVKTKPYHGIYEFVRTLRKQTVLLEMKKANYALYDALDSSNRIIDAIAPSSLMKSVKNPVEMDHMRRVHIRDGIAVTRFMRWVKTNVGRFPIDEIAASNYLDGLRRDQGCLDQSFPTISAYGEHAAMCHYIATPESKKDLEAQGLYLVDSGGQYLEGTTDVTRTFALGPLSREMKELFTAVAVGMLRLADAKFLYGCRGRNLDYIAREELWRRGLDFNHGTGHGVGYYLGVHERPAGFGWKDVPGKEDNAVLEEGMVISDEPGIYLEGKFGIRIENLLLCTQKEKNEFGQFMEFESLTCVPVDLDALEVSCMTQRDIQLLNDYHKKVYDSLSPFLNGEELSWLKEYTRPIEAV